MLNTSRCIDFPSVDEETKRWLDTLPKKRLNGSVAKQFSPEEDTKLLAAYGKVPQEILAKEFGCCIHILRRRYRELTSYYSK